jgi:O-acetyl-ADP-ribose deacetylase (regulator of RNase III)
MSMIITSGDLLKAEADAIVNTVNCVGVMGKGIALQFKKKWPENFRAYEKACKAGKVRLGTMFVHDLGGLASKPHFIINFPTKDHWRGKSELSFIEEGLKDLVRVVREYGIRSIAIPPLGCGNGGLDWNVVRPLIEQAFRPLQSEVEVLTYAPDGAPRATEMEVRTRRPKMTPGRAVLIKLIAMYRELDYSLSKIEVQKLCYFAQCAGQPLNLDFVKNQYGPYAPALRHVLTHIDGHYVKGVGDHDRAETELSLVPGALDEADALLTAHPDVHDRMERIGGLIEGFETPLGMELLATVHWVAMKQCLGKGLDCVMWGIENWEPDQPAWNERKKALMLRPLVDSALKRLLHGGWLESGSMA